VNRKASEGRASGAKKAPRGKRVPAEHRRRQLLDVAAKMLTEGSVESVTITDVAARAKVSRPLVYRLFPTRIALVRAVLDDFGEELSRAFREVLVQRLPGSLEALVEGFVEASCDLIQGRGAGPWRLLDGVSGDPELAPLGRTALRGVLAPWQQRLADLTGRSLARSHYVLWMLVTAGRSALDGWIDGTLTRKEAVADATRAITALLIAFAQDPVGAALPSPEALSRPKSARRRG
jgi:AcrR family transcriptional regulator